MVKISTSLLSIKDNLIETVKKIDKTDTDYIHIDIMDGLFVPHKSFTYGEVKKLSSYTHKLLDVHLMVKNPLKYIEDYALLNIAYITVHYEIGNMIYECINKIKDCGLKCGLSINPETNVEEIFPFLPNVDMILLMSVSPGTGGQTFILSILEKITKLKSEIHNHNLSTLIAIDGGINDEVAPLCIANGADILAVGSFIINDNHYQKQIDKLRNN